MTPAELREMCQDWDGSELPDGAEPRRWPTCGELRYAASEIERLRRTLRYIQVQAKLNHLGALRVIEMNATAALGPQVDKADIVDMAEVMRRAVAAPWPKA